jgi:hypothetical protein
VSEVTINDLANLVGREGTATIADIRVPVVLAMVGDLYGKTEIEFHVCGRPDRVPATEVGVAGQLRGRPARRDPGGSAMTARRDDFGARVVADTEAEPQRIADETGETLETVRDLHEAMQVCGSEGDDEARAERIERSVEAGLDAWSDVAAVPVAGDRAANAVRDAIETAIRVRITPEIIESGLLAAGATKDEPARYANAIAAAFLAAGFEVEQ